MNLEEIKHIKFFSRDLDSEITIIEYLKELLITLWDEKDDFSGKRPFGNSSWEYEIYRGLIVNKIVKGKLDEDDYIEEVDKKAADEIIVEVIKSIK